MKEFVNIGIIGTSGRGSGMLRELLKCEGVKVPAVCDKYEDRAKRGAEIVKEEVGADANWYLDYKEMFEKEKLDAVYVATTWITHARIAIDAMRAGKHVAMEVGGAASVEECWQMVETAEKYRVHCMQLENCCYGEAEMLCLNLVRQGFLGDIVHGEGAYIHDLRSLNYLDPAKSGYQGYWRLKWNNEHTGNPYPTHGLVPLMQAMNINRGDRFDYLTCIATNQVGMSLYAKTKYPDCKWRNGLNPKCGDMSTTVMHTVNGKTVMVQHDVTSPRPYSRINLLSGTKGCLNDYPFRIALEEKPGEGAHGWFDAKKTAEIREKYRHPLWKVAGELAKKMGGHGGMDFLMDLRLCYCLQNGLPLDMDVYDLATSCSVCELSERSALNRGNSVDIPDFTRGAWRSNKPLDIVTVDLKKLGLDDVKADDSQLNV